MTRIFVRTALLIMGLFFSAPALHAQNPRSSHHNAIGWYAVLTTYKLNARWGLHGEYQWRRTEIINRQQQGLLRVGVNYQSAPRLLLRAGYALAETYPYGEVPINGLGRAFTEHRFFQMAQLAQKEGKVDITHRYMLEQRLVGRYSSAAETREDEFPLLHRMRYMARVQMPLRGKELKDRTPYAAIYDEVFVGFGPNVNANVFDQNRLGFVLGYRINKTARIELGYLNQIVQLGRRIDNQNVFQYNNGLLVNLHLNLERNPEVK